MDAPRIAVVILAAGRGERLGADKALIELDGRTAIERVIANCAHSGCDASRTVIVRRPDAAALPAAIAAMQRIVLVETDEMIASARAGLSALRDDPPDAVLLFPVDYAMVAAPALTAIVRGVDLTARSPRIVLPLCHGLPGHPIAVSWSIAEEILAPTTSTMREVIRRDASRVMAVTVDDGFVLRDIDTRADLMAARGALANSGFVTELMARHRSRRAYRSDPVSDAQLRWLVDCARHASTSSFIQSYSVIAVSDEARRVEIATLCSNQPHIRQAPLFLAICADFHKLARACERHGKTVNTRSLEVFLEASLDAAIFGQNLCLAAESEGLGACMIGAARNHPMALARLLGLPPRVYVAFGMTLGWPSDDPEPRERMPLEAILHRESYDTSGIDAALVESDARMRAWSKRVNARATAGNKRIDEQRGWSDRMAFLFGVDHRDQPTAKGRENLGPELRKLGFGLDSDSDSP